MPVSEIVEAANPRNAFTIEGALVKINDFRNSFAFIEYKSFGDGRMQVWDACWTAGPDRNHAGTIAVFLNFKKVGEFKSKSEAVSAIMKLLEKAPNSFFDENKSVLLRDLV